MATRIDLAVGVVDETKAGNDAVIAQAAVVQKTLDQRHQELLETQRQRELEYAQKNADALLNSDHAEHSRRLAEFADFRARLQKEEERWLSDQTTPLTEKQIAAANAARELLKGTQPTPVVQQVLNDVSPVEQAALPPVVQRVVNDVVPIAPPVLSPVSQKVVPDAAPMSPQVAAPIVQRIVNDAAPVAQPTVAPVVQKVVADQAPIKQPTVAPIQQKIEVDTAGQEAAMKEALRLNAQLTKSVQELAAAERVLHQDPSTQFSESELARLRIVEKQLRDSQLAAFALAKAFREVASSVPDGGQFTQLADAIERDAIDAEGSLTSLNAKIKEIDGIKATAAIEAEGVEKTLAEFRNVSQEAATAAMKSRELWDSADKADQLASDTRKAADAIRDSGDASAKAQADFARLIAEASNADQAAAQFRHLASESEELARVALRSANSFEQLTREESRAGQEAQQLATQNQRVAASLDTAAFARHRDELAQTAAQYREAAQAQKQAENAARQAANGIDQAGGQIQQGSSRGAQGMMQLAYAADDLQYGLRGIVNNIPGLLMSLGIGGGLAGVISIAAVGLAVFSKHLQSAGQSAGYLWKELADTSVAKTAIDGVNAAVDQVKSSIETAAAVSASPFVAMKDGSEAAVKQLRDNVKAFVELQKHQEAIKAGSEAITESLNKEREADFLARNGGLKNIEALENRITGVRALIASGGFGSQKILGALYDPKDDRKNVENLKKLLDSLVSSLVSVRQSTEDEFKSFMVSHSEKQAARKREIDLIVEQATQTKALQLLESERQVVATGDETAIRIDRELNLAKVMRDRLAVEKELAEFEGSDNKPDDVAQKRIVDLVRQRGQLEAEALRLSEQAIDPAIRLRNINEEILKGLASRIEETKHAEERERGWIEDQKRIRNVTAEEIKKSEETVQALKAKRVEFEKRQESELARQKADAAKQEQAWIKLVEDTRKQADAERMKREDAMQRAAEDRITKLQNMLKGEKPQEQLKRIDEGISEKDVQKKALQERQKQARDKFTEEAQGRGLVDQNGKAIGDTPEERRRNQGRLNAEQRRINQEVARGFRKDLAGGKADEEIANVRAGLLGDIVDGGFAQGKVNQETADALNRIIDEVRQQRVEAARQAAIVAGLKQIGKGAEVQKPLEKQPLPPKAEGEIGGERLAKRNEPALQKPAKRIVAPIPAEVPEVMPQEQPQSIDAQDRINTITDEIEQLDRDLSDALQRANVAKNVPQRKAANVTVDRLSAEIDALRKRLQDLAAEKPRKPQIEPPRKPQIEQPQRPGPLFVGEPDNAPVVRHPEPVLFADEPQPPEATNGSEPVRQNFTIIDVPVTKPLPQPQQPDAPMSVDVDDADAKAELDDLTKQRDVVVTVIVDQQGRDEIAGQAVVDQVAVNQQQRDDITGQQVTDNVTVTQQPRRALIPQAVTDQVAVEQQQRTPLVSQDVVDRVRIEQEQPESRQESRQNVAIQSPQSQPTTIPELPKSQAPDVLKAVGQAMQQLGAAQQKNDSAVLDAINQLTALVTEQAKRQVQTTDVVAQVVSHVNQLSSQFTSNDNAARLRAMSAGGV